MTVAPISLMMADSHLRLENINQQKDIYSQAINLAKELLVDEIIHLGDIFESRKAQPLDVLDTFGEILAMFHKANINLIAIPGNHDKVDYESEKSYLDSFKYHPNFTLLSDYSFIRKENLILNFIPYFKEDTTYLKYLSECNNRIKTSAGIYEDELEHILLTHIAVDGVRNNDGNEEKNIIKQADFSLFKFVYVGHYHNQQDVGDNISYIASTQPTNYGEDNEKGFSILMSDGSREFIKAKFKEYHKITIDLDIYTIEQIDEFAQKYKNPSDNIRFLFVGNSQQLKSVDENKFKFLGIDVKKKDKAVDQNIENAVKGEVISFDKTSIKHQFELFCKENSLEKAEGEIYLNQMI